MPIEAPQALVVDDNEIIRLQLKRALASEGIDCDTAINGEDALEKCAHRRYPVVVTDMRMPRVHGHALAVKLLNDPLPPRIIAITAVTDRRLAKDLKTRGVDEVLYKPLNYSDLARRTKQLLETEASRHEGSQEPSTPSAEPQRAPISPAECTWMHLALEYFDWRRLPNPMSVVHDLVRQSEEAADSPSSSTEGEIAIAIGLGDEGQPVGAPLKIMWKQLPGDRVKIFHSTQLGFSRVVVMWRSRQSGRTMAIVENLEHHERPGGWEAVGTISGNWAATA